MSFNAKNLTYESNEPAFLQKLKGQYGGTNSAQRETSIGRPRRLKNEDGDDDEPTYVDGESNDTITKAQYVDMLKTVDTIPQDDESKPPDDTENNRGVDATSIGDPPKKEAVAAFGFSGKKRQAKAIAIDIPEVSDADATIGRNKKKQKDKTTKKSKKVKLSFDDDA